MISSQAGVATAIKYLLDKKTFTLQTNIIHNYQSLDIEMNPIINQSPTTNRGQINI